MLAERPFLLEGFAHDRYNPYSEPAEAYVLIFVLPLFTHIQMISESDGDSLIGADEVEMVRTSYRLLPEHWCFPDQHLCPCSSFTTDRSIVPRFIPEEDEDEDDDEIDTEHSIFGHVLTQTDEDDRDQLNDLRQFDSDDSDSDEPRRGLPQRRATRVSYGE